jgi:hypothetical protein
VLEEAVEVWMGGGVVGHFKQRLKWGKMVAVRNPPGRGS